MKALIAMFICLMSMVATAQGSDPKLYFCSMDDGSDWTARINLVRMTARLMAEDVDKTFVYTSESESIPPVYVFGDSQDCYMTFRQNRRNMQTGLAKYRCNKAIYPNSLDLDLDCVAQ